MHELPSLPWDGRVARTLGHGAERFTRFREEGALLYQLALLFGFAGLTGLSAQISIPLPFTPVPITGQVFAALLSGAVLGRYLGPASQLAYVGLGAVGVPWFAPGSGQSWFSVGGLNVVTGVLGGYLIGFILAAAAMGFLRDNFASSRSFSFTLGTFLLGVTIIYLAGAAQFAYLLHSTLGQTWLYAVLPFLPGDLLKSIVGAFLLSAVPIGAAPQPAEGRWVSRRDVTLLSILLVALWAMVPFVALTEPDPIRLPLYGAAFARSEVLGVYALAASIATAGSAAALLFRRRLAQIGRELARVRPSSG